MKIVEYGIYQLLSSLASGNVFMLRAPQNVTAPFIVVQRVAGERWRSINAPCGLAQVTVQIDCYAAEYFTMKDLSNDVENILDGYRNTVYYGSSSPQESVRIAGCSMQGESEILDQTEEPFLYRNTMTFLVTFEQ